MLVTFITLQVRGKQQEDERKGWGY